MGLNVTTVNSKLIRRQIRMVLEEEDFQIVGSRATKPLPGIIQGIDFSRSRIAQFAFAPFIRITDYVPYPEEAKSPPVLAATQQQTFGSNPSNFRQAFDANVEMEPELRGEYVRRTYFESANPWFQSFQTVEQIRIFLQDLTPEKLAFAIPYGGIYLALRIPYPVILRRGGPRIIIYP